MIIMNVLTDKKKIFADLDDFYRDKQVFISGHTGFKGAWLTALMLKLGAKVTGYALKPEEVSLYNLINLQDKIQSTFADIRDGERLQTEIKQSEPEIIFHLAAQPLVRESYDNPVYTYQTNVMGTVNILEAIRHCPSVTTMVNITTDKVYQNREQPIGYIEDDRLDGFEPYANSKSCSELVTASYRRSFFQERQIAVSTARAGNVIGGGDFAKDRIIPDCVRSALSARDILVRNPYSVRPYQHVIEPLMAYALIAMRQTENSNLQGAYNIGPRDQDCLTTGQLADKFCTAWGESLKWQDLSLKATTKPVHEAKLLYLNSHKIEQNLGFSSSWDIDTAIAKTVEWFKCYRDGGDLLSCTEQQIAQYIS